LEQYRQEMQGQVVSSRERDAYEYIAWAASGAALGATAGEQQTEVQASQSRGSQALRAAYCGLQRDERDRLPAWIRHFLPCSGGSLLAKAAVQLRRSGENSPAHTFNLVFCIHHKVAFRPFRFDDATA
jgi:hypothetical protein